MSFGTVLIPGSGIVAAYPDPKEFQNALGIYFTAWAIDTFLFLYGVVPTLTIPDSQCGYSVVALHKNIAFIFLFGTVFMTFVLLASANFTGSHKSTYHSSTVLLPRLMECICSIQDAAGIVGIFAGLAAFYVGLSELLDSERQPIIRLPLGKICVSQD
jgi:succinate-acetate transporter protein